MHPDTVANYETLNDDSTLSAEQRVRCTNGFTHPLAAQQPLLTQDRFTAATDSVGGCAFRGRPARPEVVDLSLALGFHEPGVRRYAQAAGHPILRTLCEGGIP